MMRIPRLKTLLLALLAVVLVAFGGLGAGGWYLSDVLKDGAFIVDYSPPDHDLQILALGDGTVTLGVTPETEEDGFWAKEGAWGMKGDEGYGQVGAILDIDGREVVREFVLLTGDLKEGAPVHLSRFAFPEDPQTAFGIPYEEVSFPAPLGDLSAWFIDGTEQETWAIFVHGKGSRRGGGLRILTAVTELGLPFLLITYRNDEDAPPSEDNFYRYGQTEWEDLHAAVEYALSRGAEEVVLVGYSMGGAIIANFLYESSLAPHVRAVIMDAPMIDFNATVDLGVREGGYPQFVAEIAKLFARFRFDVDWEALNYLSRADELDAPILLFHGDADTTVPVETSDALAAARPDLVEYVRFTDAVHVGAWNLDSPRYEAAVRDFLVRVLDLRP